MHAVGTDGAASTGDADSPSPSLRRRWHSSRTVRARGNAEDGIKVTAGGAGPRRRQRISEDCNGPQAAGLLRVQRDVQVEHCAAYTFLVATGSANAYRIAAKRVSSHPRAQRIVMMQKAASEGNLRIGFFVGRFALVQPL